MIRERNLDLPKEIKSARNGKNRNKQKNNLAIFNHNKNNWLLKAKKKKDNVMYVYSICKKERKRKISQKMGRCNSEYIITNLRHYKWTGIILFAGRLQLNKYLCYKSFIYK